MHAGTITRVLFVCITYENAKFPISRIFYRPMVVRPLMVKWMGEILIVRRVLGGFV